VIASYIILHHIWQLKIERSTASTNTTGKNPTPKKNHLKKMTLSIECQLPLTLSASQTLTVLSKEEVARRGMLGLKRTSVIIKECSSSVDFGFKASVNHKTAYILQDHQNNVSLFFIIESQ